MMKREERVLYARGWREAGAALDALAEAFSDSSDEDQRALVAGIRAAAGVVWDRALRYSVNAPRPRPRPRPLTSPDAAC